MAFVGGNIASLFSILLLKNPFFLLGVQENLFSYSPVAHFHITRKELPQRKFFTDKAIRHNAIEGKQTGGKLAGLK